MFKSNFTIQKVSTLSRVPVRYPRVDLFRRLTHTRLRVMATEMRICVIGAGPSGTAMLRALASEKQKGGKIPKVVCYEKQNDVGGLWNFSWRTGLDG